MTGAAKGNGVGAGAAGGAKRSGSRGSLANYDGASSSDFSNARSRGAKGRHETASPEADGYKVDAGSPRAVTDSVSEEEEQGHNQKPMSPGCKCTVCMLLGKHPE